MERLKELADQLKKSADGITGDMPLDEVKDMLVLSKCIESCLMAVIIKHKITRITR